MFKARSLWGRVYETTLIVIGMVAVKYDSRGVVIVVVVVVMLEVAVTAAVMVTGSSGFEGGSGSGNGGGSITAGDCDGCCDTMVAG